MKLYKNCYADGKRIPRWMNLIKDERGFSLIEVIVALALMVILSVIVLISLATTNKAVILADIRTTAESLAYGQMEAIKATTYLVATNRDSDGVVASYSFTPPSDGNFVICTLNNVSPPTTATIVENMIYGIPWNLNSSPPSAINTDTGIQQVTIIIQYRDETIFTLVDFVS